VRFLLSDISIVTAFFDIGRGSWTADKGFPHYLARSADIYIERFKNLCQLKNDITVFIAEEHYDKIKDIAKLRPQATTNIVVIDLNKNYSQLLSDIEKIQQSKKFQSLIHPSQIKNPEYWNPYYVLVTNLKARFTHEAVLQNLPKHDMVAWIDFGYVRDLNQIPDSKFWTYNFDPEKIHLFQYKEKDASRSFVDIISKNDVHILGAKVVASKKLWPLMDQLMEKSWLKLQKDNMVDDDQGLWLISKHKSLENFQCHQIPDHQLGYDPFVLFNEFNDSA
jgi:protein YibB